MPGDGDREVQAALTLYGFDYLHPILVEPNPLLVVNLDLLFAVLLISIQIFGEPNLSELLRKPVKLSFKTFTCEKGQDIRLLLSL